MGYVANLTLFSNENVFVQKYIQCPMKSCKIDITKSGVRVEILRDSRNIFDMRVLFDNKLARVVMVTIVQF